MPGAVPWSCPYLAHVKRDPRTLWHVSTLPVFSNNTSRSGSYSAVVACDACQQLTPCAGLHRFLCHAVHDLVTWGVLDVVVGWTGERPFWRNYHGDGQYLQPQEALRNEQQDAVRVWKHCCQHRGQHGINLQVYDGRRRCCVAGW